MRRHPFLFVGLIAFVAFAGVVAVYGRLVSARQRREPLPPVAASQEDSAAKGPTPVVSFGGSSDIVKRDAEGNIVWKASFGADVSYDKASGRVQGKDVKCELTIDRDRMLHMQAGSLDTSDNGRILTFGDGVRAHTDAPETTFRAQRASWDIRTRVLSGTGDVSVRHGSFLTRGARLRFDTLAKLAEVTGDAFLTYQEEKGGGAHARAQVGREGA